MRGCLSLLLVAACSTTHTVPKSQLDAIAPNRVGDGVVLRSTGVWKTRLDPASKIRFRNGDGKWSDWWSGDQIYINADAVYINANVDLLNYATKIELRGLADSDRQVLELARPADATLTLSADGAAVMLGDRFALSSWVASFFEAMRTTHRPNEGDCAKPDPSVCPHEQSYWHLRQVLGGQPFGTWTVHFANREPLDLAGEELYLRMDEGLPTRYGYRLGDIERAEVKSLSGSLTLAAIVGTTALAIAIAPVALFARGLPFPGDGPRGGGSGFSGSSGRSGGLDTLGRIGNGGGGGLARGDWWPVLADRSGVAAPRLFASGARRKALIQVAATAEVSVGTLGAHPVLDGGAGVLRLGQAFEIGAGGLQLLTREAGSLRSRGIAFARIGGHLPIDAAHRIAVPLSIDIGGGGGEALGVFTRLNWGVRIGLGNHSFIGIAPATPTLLNWKHEPGRRRGSLQSGLELGLVW
ncbi:MAG TPA: hypothetical protein VIV11_02355 [Kofleriaceae bacterium]